LHGTGSPQDFDAVDAVEGNRGEVGPRHVRGVEAETVHHDHHVADISVTHAPDIHPRPAVVPEKAAQVQVGFPRQQVHHVAAGGLGNVLGRDHRDVFGDAVHPRFRPGGGHHHLLHLEAALFFGSLIGTRRIFRRAFAVYNRQGTREEEYEKSTDYLQPGYSLVQPMHH
jgi:hypothetical protein